MPPAAGTCVSSAAESEHLIPQTASRSQEAEQMRRRDEASPARAAAWVMEAWAGKGVWPQTSHRT